MIVFKSRWAQILLPRSIVHAEGMREFLFAANGPRESVKSVKPPPSLQRFAGRLQPDPRHRLSVVPRRDNPSRREWPQRASSIASDRLALCRTVGPRAW